MDTLQFLIWEIRNQRVLRALEKVVVKGQMPPSLLVKA